GGRGELRRGKTPFEVFAVNLKVAQGAVQVEEMRLEGPSVRLSLAGSASVPARELDLKGVASLVAARDAAPSFELPFVVTGPWDNPLIWPDAQALISRSGAAAPLLDAVRNRLKRNPAPATGTTPAAPETDPPPFTGVTPGRYRVGGLAAPPPRRIGAGLVRDLPVPPAPPAQGLTLTPALPAVPRARGRPTAW